MSTPRKRRASWLTTLFGIMAATGLGMTNLDRGNPDSNLSRYGAILASIGALGTGLAAQDGWRKSHERKSDPRLDGTDDTE